MTNKLEMTYKEEAQVSQDTPPRVVSTDLYSKRLVTIIFMVRVDSEDTW